MKQGIGVDERGVEVGFCLFRVKLHLHFRLGFDRSRARRAQNRNECERYDGQMYGFRFFLPLWILLGVSTKQSCRRKVLRAKFRSRAMHNRTEWGQQPREDSAPIPLFH